jgi:hypothetical protein
MSCAAEDGRPKAGQAPGPASNAFASRSTFLGGVDGDGGGDGWNDWPAEVQSESVL